MRFEDFSFGFLQIDGGTYDYGVGFDRGELRNRKKKASKPFRNAYGHTLLSIEEKIPWRCRRLVIGTGANGVLLEKSRQLPSSCSAPVFIKQATQSIDPDHTPNCE